MILDSITGGGLVRPVEDDDVPLGVDLDLVRWITLYIIQHNRL